MTAPGHPHSHRDRQQAAAPSGEGGRAATEAVTDPVCGMRAKRLYREN